MQYLIGTRPPILTIRNTKHKIHLPVWGSLSNCFLADGRGLLGSRTTLFGFSLAWFLSCKKVEPENLTPALRSLQQGLRQVSSFQGCHSTDSLESTMEPVGIIPDALSKVKRVSKSFVERRDLGRRRKW